MWRARRHHRAGAGYVALGTGVALAAGCAAMRRARQMSFSDRVVVITGGSRGLGLVLARRLARKGAALALLARDVDELHMGAAQVAALGGAVLAVPCDVTDGVQIKRAIDEVATFFGRIDVLINNAGVMQVGPMEHMTERDFQQAWAAHVAAPLHASLAVIPYMKRAGFGRIANITSIGGHIAVPHMLPYTISKFATVGLSDGLRAELRQHNIRVTTVSPGLMRTGSAPNALFKGDHRGEYAWFAVAGSLPILSMSAERAARQILNGIAQGRPSVVLGVLARAAILLNAMAPNFTAWLVARVHGSLPAAQPNRSSRGRRGWQSSSKWAPSALTRLSDRAAVRNNERFKELLHATSLAGDGQKLGAS